jgi:SNF2 family DNA or RNA helicase
VEAEVVVTPQREMRAAVSRWLQRKNNLPAEIRGRVERETAAAVLISPHGWIPKSQLTFLDVNPTPLAEAADTVALNSGDAAVMLARAAANELPLPALLKTQPWSHQLAGYHFAMTRRGSFLTFEVGTGKTKVAIDVAANDGPHERVLVVCPLAVTDVWPIQLERHSPLTYEHLVLTGEKIADRCDRLNDFMRAARQGVQQWVIVNYDAAWRPGLADALLTRWQPTMVIFDEHHRIKAPGGAASKWASLWPKRSFVTRIMGLSGTPCPHSPLDLYASCRAVDPRVFGTVFARFRARFAIMKMIPTTGVMVVDGFQNQDELSRRFAAISIRVTKEDVLPDLPPVVHTRVPVTLDKPARKIYTALKNEFVAEAKEGVITAKNALVKMLRLQQVTSGHAPIERIASDSFDVVEAVTTRIDTSKRNALIDLIEDLPAEPVVVFALFKEDLRIIHEVAEDLGRPSFEISGARKELAEWRESAAPAVLAVQIRAGGLGIDLTMASTAIMYSIGFSLGDYEQAVGRLHRPGAQKKVTIIHLVVKDSVDEHLYRALDEKRDAVAAVFQALTSDNGY